MKQLADIVGVSEGTVSRWESGDIANMRRDKIVALAKALRISPAVIMGWEEDKPDLLQYGFKRLEQRVLPVMGDIACGTPSVAIEERRFVTLADVPSQATHIFVATGDSMINARIKDGDYVFIREQPEVENGEIAAVMIGEDATLKRFYRTNDTITLVAENPAYDPLVYSGPDCEQIRVLGKAIAFQSPLTK